MSVAVLSLQFRAPLVCPVTLWHCLVPIPPYFDCIAITVRSEFIALFIILAVIVFLQTMFQFGFLSWSDCLALEQAVSGIRVTPEHRMALFPHLLRAVSPPMLFIVMLFLANHDSFHRADLLYIHVSEYRVVFFVLFVQ